MIFCVRPETTIFIVVSAHRTDMGLGGVPETTVKIGVSGTPGERGKPAEPKKGGKTRIKTCFGVLCLKPLFLQWFQAQHTGVVLAHVPETTAKIVVSGAWGDEDEEAKEGKKIKSRQISKSLFFKEQKEEERGGKENKEEQKKKKNKRDKQKKTKKKERREKKMKKKKKNKKNKKKKKKKEDNKNERKKKKEEEEEI